jgi:hypothetical protein
VRRINTGPRAPSLTLSFEPKGAGGYEVLLNKGSSGSITIGQGRNTYIENDVLPFIRETLEEIRSQFGGLIDHKASPYDAFDVLTKLKKKGNVIWNMLLDEAGLTRLKALARNNESKTPKALALEYKTPPEWPIPVELLPLYPAPKAASPADEVDLSNFARIFPAFRNTIRHVFLDSSDDGGDGHLPTEKSIQSSSGMLPLLFLWHDGAPSADEAYKAIRALRNSSIAAAPDSAVVPDGPFPCEAKFPSKRDLAQLLMEQGWYRPDSQGGTTSAIVHIHAHGEIGRAGLAAHTLRFAYRRRNGALRLVPGSRRSVPVTNEDLSDVVGDLTDLAASDVASRAIDPASLRSQNGPFIFINACGGTAPSYSGGLGLAGLFLRHGYRAVIGPRVAIPGSVAECMARHFYEQLLSGCDLAEALLNSRTRLFRECLNPLGALYAVHGESGLHIAG